MKESKVYILLLSKYIPNSGFKQDGRFTFIVLRLKKISRGMNFSLLYNIGNEIMTTQLIWLFTLAIPIACIAWTVTHEEVFVEIREYCINSSKTGKNLLVRKFFYLFTCEYCFSHYVTILMLCLTDYHLLFYDWRGYILAGFSLVWIANLYMSLFALLRTGIKVEKTQIKAMEDELEKEEHKTGNTKQK
jgi:hypothetical protein